MAETTQNETLEPLFKDSLSLSPNIDYFQNGDDFFVYHNTYGYILKMSEDLVDFLEFFNDGAKTAEEMEGRFGEAFDRDTLSSFLSIFRTLACLVPDDGYEPAKTREMYPTTARWITADETDGAAVRLYVFDSQTQDKVHRITLDAWESKLWGRIQGNRTVGEMAEEMALEDSVTVSDEEERIRGTLALWTHWTVQAVKLSAEPVTQMKTRRFGIPPYLISTMPYRCVTAEVRTVVDESGQVVAAYEEPPRCRPSVVDTFEIDQDTLRDDHNNSRLSALLAGGHGVLGGRTYGRALYDMFDNHGAIQGGGECSILEVGEGCADTVRGILGAFDAEAPGTSVSYTLFVPDAGTAARIRTEFEGEGRLRVLSGDVDGIDGALGDGKFDIVFSNEFLADLKSDAVRKIPLGGDTGNDEDDEVEDDDDRPDTGEHGPVHASDAKVTFIGEGDSVGTILKYKLNLADAPEDFILNTGSVRLLGSLTKHLKFTSHMFLIEFGEDIKYPVRSAEDGRVAYSQHFGVLRQAAQKLGFVAQSGYLMDEIGLERDVMMFATTRSQYRAVRRMLADHGVELERRPYTREEFTALLSSAGINKLEELNFEPAEDRISGLVPHSYKVLHVFHELEF